MAKALFGSKDVLPSMRAADFRLSATEFRQTFRNLARAETGGNLDYTSRFGVLAVIVIRPSR